MFIDFHVIQTVPPSLLNRDDTGSPKTSQYGGTTRLRVSSQSWKHAMRRDFADLLDESEIGVRTKRAAQLIAERIVELAPTVTTEEATGWAIGVLAAAKIDVAEPKKRGKKAEAAEGGEDQPQAVGETGALLFLSRSQITAVAQLAIDSAGKPARKDAEAAIRARSSIDLALFGRMVASNPTLQVDGGVSQFAHAISVDTVAPEFDYYTAIDEAKEGSLGAAMIGSTEFASATLYRYASVQVDQLAQVLGDVDATVAALAAFTRTFITSMPSGKSRSFGHRGLPELVLVTVRPDQPVSLARAFLEPVDVVGDRGLEASRRLLAHAGAVHAQFSGPDYALLLTLDDAVAERAAAWADRHPLNELVEAVQEAARSEAEAVLGVEVS